MEIVWMYILTMLIPIHGALFLGLRLENQSRRNLLKSLWNVRKGGLS
jgi:hypothetical protein